MKDENSGMYNIKGFKHFSQLAWEYFSDLSCASAASRKMRSKINSKEGEKLYAELTLAEYTNKTTELSPEMQRIIYRHWGPPEIYISKDTEPAE